MHKITIKHLGPIEDLKFEIKDFNVIIGEQATGKSTVAKSVYFFRTVKEMVTDYLCQLYDTSLYNGKNVEGGFKKALKKELKSKFISLFGYSWDLDKRLFLKYEFAPDVWVKVSLYGSGGQYINVTYSETLVDEIRNLEREALELYAQKADAEEISLAYAIKEQQINYSLLKVRVNKVFDDSLETYYVPAGRSLITLMTGSKFAVDETNLDLVTKQFLQIIERIQSGFADGIRGLSRRYPQENLEFDARAVAEWLIDGLKGNYVYSAGHEYLVLQNKRKERIKINFASSGQQEVLWLLNLLYVLMLKKEKSFVIIEEPEAHLYPELQSRVVEFISLFVNVNQSAVLITTHSP